MLSAIIVAAGTSRRMGFDKLFAPLAGRPVLAHTLRAFEQANCVDEIILVAQAERVPEFREFVRSERASKVRQIVVGGEHRQDSVRSGLDAVAAAATYVAVHDAARPLITCEQIAQVFTLAVEHGAASLAQPITDTLKRADEKHFVANGVDRAGLYAMQTPQIFFRDLLIEAYRAVMADKISVTDEVSAVQHLGKKVLLLPNEQFNPKITFASDLHLAEAFLNHQPTR